MDTPLPVILATAAVAKFVKRQVATLPTNQHAAFAETLQQVLNAAFTLNLPMKPPKSVSSP